MAASEPLTPLVHIVDDDADFRDGLAWLLDSRGLRTRCWSGGEQFLADLRPGSDTWACGVMLLDIRMEPLSGLATFEQLKAQGWPWPILFLTGHGDLSMAVAAVKNGAWDFLEEALSGQPAGRQGRGGLPPKALVLQTESQQRLRFQQALAALSQREREVLNELLQGHYNKNIADHLGITPRTVEFHRANIFEKLQVQSAVELAHLMGRYAPGSA